MVRPRLRRRVSSGKPDPAARLQHDNKGGPVRFLAKLTLTRAQQGVFQLNGVHFIGLVNVMHFKPNGLGGLGDDQLAWLSADLKGRSSSTPIVVFAHMPMWTIYEPWGWGTGDAGQAMSNLKRFGSVTVLNGHIHQIVSKMEGNITFHTARSTAYPQPTAGNGPGPGPLKVTSDQLPSMLGVTSIKIMRHPFKATLADMTLA
jgi:3',5'-cyclic AMP phosphodiesterase CpdA